MTPARAIQLNATLTTTRLTLEPLTGAHADALFPVLQEPGMYTWISVVPPPSVEALRARWASKESRLATTGTEAQLAWAVRRRSDGAYIGKADANVDDTQVATNIGYLFTPAFWGQGYATEVVEGIVTHLSHCGVTEVRAAVTVGNDASVRVLEKNGFRRTRILPANDIIRGVAHDDIELVRCPAGPLIPPNPS